MSNQIPLRAPPPTKSPPLTLPTAKVDPAPSIETARILLYGPSKFGKSTLCSKFPSAVFLWTERGLDGLSVYRCPESQPIQTWEEFLSICNLLREGQHQFKTVIVDTLDNMYELCRRAVLKKLRIEHEQEAGHGKGYGLVNDEFKRVLHSLGRLPYGLVLISHSKVFDMENSTQKYQMTSLNLSTAPREICLAFADIILFCDHEREKNEETGKTEVKRVLRTKPSLYYNAGDRFNKLPHVVPFSVGADPAQHAFDVLEGALKK